MKLPYAPAKVFHKQGERALEITDIGHGIDKARDDHSPECPRSPAVQGGEVEGGTRSVPCSYIWLYNSIECET